MILTKTDRINANLGRITHKLSFWGIKAKAKPYIMCDEIAVIHWEYYGLKKDFYILGGKLAPRKIVDAVVRDIIADCMTALRVAWSVERKAAQDLRKELEKLTVVKKVDWAE